MIRLYLYIKNIGITQFLSVIPFLESCCIILKQTTSHFSAGGHVLFCLMTFRAFVTGFLLSFTVTLQRNVLLPFTFAVIIATPFPFLLTVATFLLEEVHFTFLPAAFVFFFVIVKVVFVLFSFGAFLLAASALIGIANVSMIAAAVMNTIDFLMICFIMLVS